VRRILVVVVSCAAVVGLVGCSGRTTGATNLTAYSARLQAVGSCDNSCTTYMRYRRVGTTAWTETNHIDVGNRVDNVPFHFDVAGLTADADYEYQVCGKEASYNGYVCVGPGGDTGATDKFHTPPGASFPNRGVYTWTVPAGVTHATFDLYGAQGGPGVISPPPATGGLGAHVRASLATTAGRTYTLTVGGQGGSPNNGPGPGGFPGNAAPGGAGVCGSSGGGGGGGEADVRTGPGDISGLASRLLVAGGGGGAGQGNPPEPNGGAGGPNGVSAADGSAFGLDHPVTGGGGGTQTAGGAGGSGGGQPGTFGIGGAGGSNTGCQGNPFVIGTGGGGGAGGYYGGGGGSFGAQVQNSGHSATGGGGGSSFITPSATCSQPTETGVRQGDGLIVITYNTTGC
jgi:hypothetical protein